MMRSCRRPLGAFVVLALSTILGCADGDPVAAVDSGTTTEDPNDAPDPTDPVTMPPHLLEATELRQGLFGWPEQDFGRGNAATIELARFAEDDAVDFTLRDVDGHSRRLAQLLNERPVLLVLGSFT